MSLIFVNEEQRYKQFFKNNPEYCYMISPEGLILEINKLALNILGYSHNEIIGKPLLTTIYAPSSIEKAKKLFEKWKKDGQLKNEELTIITKQGEEKTVLLNVDSIKDSNGRLICSISVQKDITEFKKIEKQIKEKDIQLTQMNIELEKKVKSFEINQKINEGRELELIKLQKEIDELRKRLGERPKYFIKD